MHSEQPVRVSFACNDHRNGSFAGRFGSVEIDMGGGEMVTLDNGISTTRDPKLTWHNDNDRRDDIYAITVHRRKFRAHYRQCWEGNWCWDACQMTLGEARRLFAWLTDLGFEVQEWTDAALSDLRELP